MAARLVSVLGLACLACLGSPAHAALTLPQFLGSHMVIPHSVPFQFFGWSTGEAGNTVTVAFNGAKYTSSVAADGSWGVVLAATPASATPQTVTVASSGGASLALTDVVVGTTILCSGQSNAQLTVFATVNGTLADAESGNFGGMLRIFQVALSPSYPDVTTPQQDLNASIVWSRAAPGYTGGMSAICYYLALEMLQSNPSVPVGAVASSWGGESLTGPVAVAAAVTWDDDCDL
jgi:sialate O-acetylesterase